MYFKRFLNNLFLTTFLAFLCVYSNTQTPSTAADSSGIEQPEFVGGQAELLRYFTEHYPKAARLEGIEGKVFVNFVVEIDGRISEIKVVEANYFRTAYLQRSQNVSRFLKTSTHKFMQR